MIPGSKKLKQSLHSKLFLHDDNPAFRHARLQWLRRKHRAPLAQRAQVVLGEGWALLLDDLCRCFPKDADFCIRTILRKASAIAPANPDGLRRRRAYIRVCIRNEHPQPDVKEDEIDPDVLEQLDPEEIRALTADDMDELRAVRRRANETPYAILQRRLGTHFNSLFDALNHALRERYPNDDERQINRLTHLLGNAAHARSPQLYLRRIIQNEKSAVKRKRV